MVAGADGGRQRCGSGRWLWHDVASGGCCCVRKHESERDERKVCLGPFVARVGHREASSLMRRGSDVPKAKGPLICSALVAIVERECVWVR